MAADTIALYFAPANEGDHVIGIPARDLTEADVEELTVREPAAFRNATTPHPTTGRAVYQPTKPSGKRAEAIEANKQAVQPPPVVPAEAPAKGV